MFEKMADYVERHPYEIYVDYNDELSKEQVTQILDGKSIEVRWEIEDADSMYENDYSYYWETMCGELGCTMEDVEKWLSEDDGFYPSHEMSEHEWKKLLDNTSVCITATVWDAEWNFGNWAYNGPVNYADVKETLKILGINPLEFKQIKVGGSMSGGDQLRGWFPDMPNREPKVDPKELWNNMIVLYDGVLNFCLGDLSNIAEALEDDPKYLTFTKGTNIVMYDFGNGAGITETQLTGDVKIPRKMVEFRNDADNQYGIQECYGFVHSYWKEGCVYGSK
jgi:hypothetical protein